MNEVNHIAINCNSSSLAKATRAVKASSRSKLVGLELAAPYLWPGFLSEVDKAATRAEALVPRHSFGESGASHRKQKHRAMFCSICVSEPDYAYILRRCW
jgi:hypothetical protein